MMPVMPELLDDACYLALAARDARFDGRFFTGVTSTGIYCRPVCRVRTPRRENCRFFSLAAQAEAAGFRPCLRCRPELAPRSLAWSTQDATQILAVQAARLIDEPEAWDAQEPSIQALATRLGVSDRHLRRIFEARHGVSPLQYLQTRRLLTAKQLLTDTDLPVAQVALASGFASIRRFNAAFVAHYGLQPMQLRRSQGALSPAHGNTQVRLGYRPPYDARAMIGFLARRAVPGLEAADVADGSAAPRYRRSLQLRVNDGAGSARVLRGSIDLRFDEARLQVHLAVGGELRDVLPRVISRVRALLDLDADPGPINACLHERFPAGDGWRVPGCVDGFELAVRAILGQQVTVAAARTFTERLVGRFGSPIETGDAQLTHLFPAPQALAEAPADALGALGIVRQRQAAILGLARAVSAGDLALHGGVDLPATLERLKALPGVGDWTAQYVAMRALRWPDAFPAADIALQKALGVRGERAARAASEAWRPWRSYAVLRAWHAPIDTRETA
jgi:AraC family transcriptional regulator of adaptative response / DNA-3-methyladenine glycosylase II